MCWCLKDENGMILDDIQNRLQLSSLNMSIIDRIHTDYKFGDIMKQIIITKYGDTDVLKVQENKDPKP